jgi:hypothetical protein
MHALPPVPQTSCVLIAHIDAREGLWHGDRIVVDHKAYRVKWDDLKRYKINWGTRTTFRHHRCTVRLWQGTWHHKVRHAASLDFTMRMFEDGEYTLPNTLAHHRNMWIRIK